MVTEHALNDLTGPSSIDCFLFHLFVPGGKRGFHHFGSNGLRESLEEEVGAFVVSRGVFGKAE